MISLVSSPDPTSKEEKGLVNLGRILGPALRNFHAPMRSDRKANLEPDWSAKLKSLYSYMYTATVMLHSCGKLVM